MTITAAVDGSALGNPGPAGWAWVVSDEAWAAGGFDRATNNVGELTALLMLLRDTQKAGLADEPLIVLADSQYVINSVTKWMPNWKRRGWKKADGKPVANEGLMRDLDAALAGRDVKFNWVKGHAGHELNEAADLRARAAAEAHKNRQPAPCGPAFTRTIGSATATAEGMRRPRNAAPPREEVLAKPQRPTLSVVSSQEATERWEEVMSAAAEDPVTVTRSGQPPLLLLDADLAWRALALLDEDEVAEGTLF